MNFKLWKLWLQWKYIHLKWNFEEYSPEEAILEASKVTMVTILLGQSMNLKEHFMK